MYEEVGNQSEPDTGWGHVAEYDEAAAVVGAIIHLDPDEEYTKTELSEAAGVALKTLYLDGTFEHLVALGLLEKHDFDGAETTFSANADSEVYEIAAQFDDAVMSRLETRE